MDSATRLEARNVTQELTDLVGQLSSSTRTPKEALRWFGKIDSRLSQIEMRVIDDVELKEYLVRARVLATKAKAFIQKKMNELDQSSLAPAVKNEPSYDPLAAVLIADKSLSVVKVSFARPKRKTRFVVYRKKKNKQTKRPLL
jgi:hypothetical protein